MSDALLARRIEHLHLLDLTISGPTALLDHLEGGRALIVIDALHVPGLAPGEIVDADWDGLRDVVLASEPVCSTHAFSVASQIELARRLEMLPPRMRLIGAVAHSVRLGDAPGLGLERAVPHCVDRVLQHVHAWSEAR